MATRPQRMQGRPRARDVPASVGIAGVQSLGALTGLAMPIALYLIFIWSPPEAVMGDVWRIFYVHISLAILMYVAFTLVLVGSVWYLLRGRPGADRLARVSAELGVVCTTLVLITGAIWGRPVWGVWWVWDARLTATLVLWFVYVGYLLLRSFTSEHPAGPRYAAVLGIIGFVDVPIVHFAVNWWRTLHPPQAVLRPGPVDLPGSMAVTLGATVMAFGLLFAFLSLQRLRVEGLRDEIAGMRQRLLDLDEAAGERGRETP